MIKVKPLQSVLGAEVVGLNLKHAIKDVVVGDLEEALAEYGVLVFREQFLTEDEQAEFSKCFGNNQNSNLQKSAQSIENPTKSAVHRGKRDFIEYYTAGPEFYSAGFTEEHPQWVLNLFHADLTYSETPLQYTMLSCLEAPEHGGETEFIDVAQAYDNLPDNLKKEAYSREAYHAAEGLGYNDLVAHPIVARNAVSGRTILYLNRMFGRGIERDENHELFNALMQHIEGQSPTFKYKWGAGDFIIWDNTRVLHRRCEYPDGERRVLRRAQSKNITIEPGYDARFADTQNKVFEKA